MRHIVILLTLLFCGATTFGQKLVATSGTLSGITLFGTNTQTGLLNLTGTANFTGALQIGGVAIGSIYQPLDSDLTAIAALSTTANGRSLLTASALTGAGLGLTNGANIDAWGAKTIYAGSLAITTGKTLTSSNTLTLAGTDGSTLNIGTGGTLGTAAYTAASAYATAAQGTKADAALQSVAATGDVENLSASGTTATLAKIPVGLNNSYKRLFDIVVSGSASQLVWLVTGDSVGSFKPDYIVQNGAATLGGSQNLKKRLTDRGVAFGAGQYFISGGGALDAADYTKWITGETVTLTSTNSCTYGASSGGALAAQTANVMGFAFPTITSGAGAHQWKLRSSPDNSTWTDETNVTVVSGTTVLQSGVTNIEMNYSSVVGAVAYVTKGSAAPYYIQAVRVLGSPKIIPSGLLLDRTASGVVYACLNKGGADISTSTMRACPAAILNPIMTFLNPNVVSFECKDTAALWATDLSPWQSLWTTACPNADFIDIASTPNYSDGTSDADQVSQNALLRAAAITNGHFFFDSYSIATGAQIASNFGWQTQPHPGNGFNKMAAGLLYDKTGWKNFLDFASDKAASGANADITGLSALASGVGSSAAIRWAYNGNGIYMGYSNANSRGEIGNAGNALILWDSNGVRLRKYGGNDVLDVSNQQLIRNNSNSIEIDWAARTFPGSTLWTMTPQFVFNGGIKIGASGTAVTQMRHGTSGAMTAGTVTVTDTSCTANTRYYFTTHTIGTVSIPSSYYASTRTASTSFVITSSQITDTSTVDWFAVEP